MLSKRAIKLRKRYSKFASLLSFLAYDSDYPSNIKNKIHFDLPNFIKSQLKSSKIIKIEVIKIDTFDNKNNFYSARRSLKLKHDDYGRNISIIMIN